MQTSRLLFIISLFGVLYSCENHRIMDYITEYSFTDVSQDTLVIDMRNLLDVDFNSYFIICGPACSEDYSVFLGFDYKGRCIQDDQFAILFCRDTKVVYSETFMARRLGWCDDMSGKYDSAIPLRIIQVDDGLALVK